jgi:uncharacterized protein (DUF302 family)
MYAFSVDMDVPVAEAVMRLTSALAEEKLGIVSDVNVQGVMKAKLNEEFRPYRILGACAPGLAKSIIGADADSGALLPCNIVVQERDGRTRVSFMDPVPVLGLAGNPAIDDIARQARAMLERVRGRLGN